MIILTGASGGIGHAILPLLSTLDNVIALYNNNHPNVTGLTGVSTYKVDLTSEQDVANFVLASQERFEKITIIHAAALARSDKLAVQFQTEDWDDVMNVNLKGDFLLTRALLMTMIRQNWGRIIHISSVAGIRGIPGTLAYSATKSGVIGMSRVLANEYARFGITSNVLLAGYFNTGLVETLSDKMRKKILESIPSGQLGDPINIFNAVKFLIESDYVNGSAINIDGGI
jgi:NAD(P)-dependent dehydrogenase (short-subunit alcohol dehydrogenase family)